MAMDPSNETGEALEAVVVEETFDEASRTRKLTEKGLQYQVNLKTKNLKAKRLELIKQVRSTLLLRGQNEQAGTIKYELSKAQVLLGEFHDIFEELKCIVNSREEDINEAMCIKEQTECEWRDFERDIKAEIRYLEQLNIEQQKLEVRSCVSSKSKRSTRSSMTKTSSVKSAKLYLEQKQAALSVKLSFMEEERKLKSEQRKTELMKVEYEEKLEKLRLQSEIAQNQAKLNVCVLNERVDEISLTSDQNLLMDQNTSKEEVMKKFLDSVSASTGVACSEEQKQPDVRDHNPFSKPPVPTLEKPNPSQPFSNLPASAIPQENLLEKCMDKLVDVSTKLTTATLEQNYVNRKIAISRQLPNISIPVFDGDPLQYPIWASSFKAFIDSKPMDAQTKLNFLSQFVTGNPKKVVEHFLLIGTENAYHSAKALLYERYGNSNVVSSTLIGRLDAWPSIGARNADALRDFSDFLLKIKAAKATIASLDVLDFAKENVKMLAKLPYYIQNKWRDYIKQWRELYGEDSYPPFSNFVDFIKDCADKANIPELAELSKFKETSRQGKRINLDRAGVSAYTAIRSEEKNSDGKNTKAKELENSKTCLFCRGDHDISSCETFAGKSFKERKNFFFKNHLCLGCCCNGHVIANCKHRLKCNECSRLHPTCLHIKKNEDNGKEKGKGEEKENLSNCINVCPLLDQDGGTDNAMIVPVWVRRTDEPSKEFLQYAILDDQSNVSFISKNLCNRLGVQGPSTELLLSTMQESKVRVQSNRIRGLEVLDYQRELVVKLPVLFMRNGIPSNRSQIPRPEVAAQWEHLRVIADKMMPYDPNVEISMLIGNNCPRIVRPREVIVGRDDDPYGQRSLLGWGIIGNVCTSSEKDDQIPDGYCNKIVVKSYPNFAFATKAKEIIQPQKVLEVLESDFVERHTEHKAYSVEDERFIRILENGIKQLPDGHYEMPLPLKSDTIALPKNKPLAVKRWQQLLMRFKKNSKFLSDYKVFMEDVLDNYAERVPQNRLDVEDGKINYVPHTGIYHPKKPGRIRVVFDCSARFNGISLNDHLLQGPDQTNNLLGILCRFRQERIAFLTDIKGMFHQFMVSEEYRDLLRFLWESGTFQSQESVNFVVNDNDPEVKKAVVSKVCSQESREQYWDVERLNHVSDWYRAQKIIALCLRLKVRLRRKEVKKPDLSSTHNVQPLPRLIVSLSELEEAKKEILRAIQREHFGNEIRVLMSLKVKEKDVSRKMARNRNKEIKKYSLLYRLDPFLDDDGLVRVGGRIKRANFPLTITHPIVIPRKSHITNLLIQDCHLKVNHMGRGSTHNQLRQRGYWIIGGTSAVSNMIAKCVVCRRLRGFLQNQKMSELPKDRIEPSPPFSYCAVDFFGPFTIKEKRSQVKRYGVLFTCLASRSVHLETANSLNTSSFINALSRFLNRRGPVRQLRCDQGTNFVGARNELKDALKEMDQCRIHEYTVQHGAEWVPFQMNVPHASHMGGSWERMIRTVRDALETLLISSGSQLDDEAFRTFMTEVESIVNSRPLTTKELSDPEALEPLTPNHLLTFKPKVLLPPPGQFQKADLYSRKWWRRVQYLANEFWLRWRREVLHNLQSRQKWNRPQRNMSVGDIVISKESDEPRNNWPLAKVVDVYPSADGYVRKVRILKSDGDLDNQGRRKRPPSYLDRPVHKLVLLLSQDES